MKRKTIADKIADGTAEVSGVCAWWPRHSCEVASYLKVAANPRARQQYSDILVKLARCWDELLDDPEELMVQHSGMEIALINAAVTADGEAIDKLQVGLEENARQHALLLSKRTKGFPVGTFMTLMRDHVRHLLEAVGHWTDGSPRKLAACESKRRQNAVSLGMLLTEWI